MVETEQDSGRRTLITGASSGLGAGLAQALARRGDRLVLFARRADRLEAVAQRAQANHPHKLRPLVFPLDVTDTEAVERAVREAQAQLGGIDLLILNAGIGDAQRVERFDFEDAHRLARMLEVNLVSTLYLLGAVLPGMRARRRGHIVGVSSLAAYRGLPGSWVYSASKAGLSTLLEGLRIDLRPYGIAVTTISPGFVRTAITERNRFPMPFLMDLEPAVRIMCRGIERRAREVRFPWQLALAVRLLRAMPDPFYDWIARRFLGPADKAPASG